MLTCVYSLSIHWFFLLVQLDQEVQAARQVSVNALIIRYRHSYTSMLLPPVVPNANKQ